MNNTIDFNTAKTIGTMSKKIDHIDDTVSGFFSFMHMVMQNELGNAEPYGRLFLFLLHSVDTSFFISLRKNFSRRFRPSLSSME